MHHGIERFIEPAIDLFRQFLSVNRACYGLSYSERFGGILLCCICSKGHGSKVEDHKAYFTSRFRNDIKVLRLFEVV